jgi:tetratricopeptide (TPR) repeat protein
VASRLRRFQLGEALLKPRWRSALFLLALGLAGGFLAYQVVRVAWATTLVESPHIADLQKGLALDPDNPALLHRLGLLYAYSPAAMNPEEGVKYLHRAADLNPHSAAYWGDWAMVCASLGDTACADRAFDHARLLQPMMPRLQWIIGNHYLQTDRVEAALQVFQHLLAMSAEYARPVFRLCRRVTDDPLLVYQKVLPPGNDPQVKLLYLNFLSEQNAWDSAYQVWVRMAAHTAPFAFPSIDPYLDGLLQRGRFREAQTVWLDLGRLGVVAKPGSEDHGSLVSNGGFERPPLNAGFDWRYAPVPYLSADFQDLSAYRGARCLRVDFTVARNEEYEPVYQIASVTPNRSYLLAASVRSENITSDSGPRLRVVDLSCGECPTVASETTVGTTSWHPVSVKFTTGPQTQAVRVEVWRPRSRAFPTEITGSFWLDDVTVKALDSSDTSPDPSASHSVR